MSDQKMEKEIVGRGLTYPRITNAEIEKKMVGVKYHTNVEPGSTTTVIKASLPMGHMNFTLAVDIMACDDPRNFNAEVGEKYGKIKLAAQAKDKLWELEGYRLAYYIANAPANAKERLGLELDDLLEREARLLSYTCSDHYNSLDKEAKALLLTQKRLMCELSDVLDIRFKNWKD